MEVLTSILPSKYSGYEFPNISVNPMTYSEVLEYERGRPETEFLQFLYDLKWVRKDDPNIDKILLVDAPFIIFLKKFVSVSRDISLNMRYTCPVCGTSDVFNLKLAELDFIQHEEENLFNVPIELEGGKFRLNVRTIEDFERLAGNYVRSKQITDLSIIKLISLFSEYDRAPNLIQESVLNATYEDITTLSKIESYYFDKLKPVHAPCKVCSAKAGERRNVVIKIESLLTHPFREILQNNAPIKNEEILEQIWKNR